MSRVRHHVHHRRRQASRHRAHQGPEGRPRRARRHLPLRRAGVRRHRARRPRPVSLVRHLHPARRAVGGVRRSGPVRGHRRVLHAADQVPERRRHRRSAAGGRAPVGAVRARHGRHHDPPEHPAPLASDRGHAGHPRRAERRRPLVHPGLRRRVAKRGRLPARGRRRARAHRLAPADRGARADVRGRPPLLEPAAQVQGVGVGVPAPVRAARDQRHRPRGRREGRRGGLRRVGWRGAGRVRPHGPAARRLRAPGGGGRRLPRDHRDLPRRGQAHQAHAGPHQVPRRRVGRRAPARRGRAEARARASHIRRAGRPRRSAPRSPGRPPAGPAGPLLPGRDDAPRTVHRRPDDRRRRHRGPVRLGGASLHEPPEHHRARRARRAGRRGRRRRFATSASRPRPRRSAAASSRARAWSSASSRSSRPRSGPPS